MPSLTHALALLLTGLAAALAARAWAALATRWGWLAHPGPRRPHPAPVPTSGGLPVAAVLAASLLWHGAGAELIPLGLLCAALGLLGLVDDRWELGPLALASLQTTAVVFYTAHQGAPFPWNVLSGLALLAFINFTNFMDGLDGLVPAVAALLLIALGLGSGVPAQVAWLSAAAVAGFAWVNRPPARVFVGNSGAYALGAWLGGLALMGGPAPRGWAPGVVILAPLWIDPAVTLMGRLRRGEPFWLGHRQHHYQRLHDRGWSPRRVVALWSAWAALSVGLAAAVAAGLPGRWVWPLGLLLHGAVAVGIAQAAQDDSARDDSAQGGAAPDGSAPDDSAPDGSAPPKEHR